LPDQWSGGIINLKRRRIIFPRISRHPGGERVGKTFMWNPPIFIQRVLFRTPHFKSKLRLLFLWILFLGNALRLCPASCTLTGDQPTLFTFFHRRFEFCLGWGTIVVKMMQYSVISFHIRFGHASEISQNWVRFRIQKYHRVSSFVSFS